MRHPLDQVEHLQQQQPQVPRPPLLQLLVLLVQLEVQVQPNILIKYFFPGNLIENPHLPIVKRMLTLLQYTFTCW